MIGLLVFFILCLKLCCLWRAIFEQVGLSMDWWKGSSLARYSSPGFFSKPETTVQPGKNPNKTRILLLFKQSELDFPREK